MSTEKIKKVWYKEWFPTQKTENQKTITHPFDREHTRICSVTLTTEVNSKISEAITLLKTQNTWSLQRQDHTKWIPNCLYKPKLALPSSWQEENKRAADRKSNFRNFHLSSVTVSQFLEKPQCTKLTLDQICKLPDDQLYPDFFIYSEALQFVRSRQRRLYSCPFYSLMPYFVEPQWQWKFWISLFAAVSLSREDRYEFWWH